MIGQTVSHYRILEKLGAGGMGEVYLAQDTKLERKVALKFLPSSLWNESEAQQRLIREARAASKLDHPNVVTIFGIEEHAGRPFIIMAYVQGTLLKEYCAAKTRSTDELIDLAVQIADGLQHAHEAGVVHRDLKPSNVLVSDQGRARILDFGIASLRGAAKLTQTGSTVGTIAYAPPELAQGKEATPASDVYSLGVVMYQMLSGRLPFEADHEAALLYSILHEAPKPLAGYNPGVTPEIQRIVEKCLEKQPERRFGSCAELSAELRRRRFTTTATASGSGRGKPSIAVLPFANMSADPENEYFSDGLTEELLNVLAKNPELKVTGRTSSFAFKGKQVDLREIGQKLGVETILEGSVRKSGKKVRITAQLVKASDGFHLWTETYDRVLEDIFAVQDEIAGAVSAALNVRLLGTTGPRPAHDAEAHNLVMQGYHFIKHNSSESLAEAVRVFRGAIELDPDYAPAWAGLSWAYLIQGGYGHVDCFEVFPKSKEAALRAVELDGQLVSAHIQLGWAHMVCDADWQAADRSFKRAMELAPGQPECLFASAARAAMSGRFDEAIALMRRAIENDPLSAVLFFHLGRIQWWAGRNADAEASLRRTLALSPEFSSARATLALALLGDGKTDDALREAAKEKDGGYRQYALAIVHYALGERPAADAALVALEAEGAQWACQIAAVRAFRGESDEAFMWLDKAIELHDGGIPWTAVMPLLSNLHGDPRWAEYLKKTNLG